MNSDTTPHNPSTSPLVFARLEDSVMYLKEFQTDLTTTVRHTDALSVCSVVEEQTVVPKHTACAIVSQYAYANGYAPLGVECIIRSSLGGENYLVVDPEQVSTIKMMVDALGYSNCISMYGPCIRIQSDKVSAMAKAFSRIFCQGVIGRTLDNNTIPFAVSEPVFEYNGVSEQEMLLVVKFTVTLNESVDKLLELVNQFNLRPVVG